MFIFGSAPLIGEDKTVLLWAVVLVVVAISIVLEQRYKWAASLGSVVLCIFIGLFLSNIGIIPYSSGVFSGIGNVVLLCAIPLMLFKANIVKILKDSGKLFLLFHIAAIGTVVGVLVAFIVFRVFGNTKYLLTIISAAAVGGTVNCVAMGSIFDIPYTDKFEAAFNGKGNEGKGQTNAAAFWGGKEIGIKDIALALALTFSIVGVSSLIANWVVSLNPPAIIAQLFGSVYLIMTIITVILATAFSKFMGNIRGTLELGNIGMLAWFVTIGASGNLVDIIKNGALSLGLLAIVIPVNILFAVIGAKLIKATWEDAVNATCATVGGPPTAAAASVTFGWDEMVVPGILVGLWGYIIGSYFGIFAGNIMGVPSLLG